MPFGVRDGHAMISTGKGVAEKKIRAEMYIRAGLDRVCVGQVPGITMNARVRVRLR